MSLLLRDSSSNLVSRTRRASAEGGVFPQECVPLVASVDDPQDAERLRDGEIAVAMPRATDAGLVFIGRIETPWRLRTDCPRQGDSVDGPICRLIIAPPWEPALDGLETGAALQVLYWMHEARRDLVRLAPREGRPRGPFALRAPTRPNPIAASIVRLEARNGAILAVRGLDCIDGTPLLDLKPWRGG